MASSLLKNIVLCNTLRAVRQQVHTAVRPRATPLGRVRAMAEDAAPSLGKMRLAVGQMTATNNIDANFAACSRLAKSAADEGCGLLALPECFAFIGEKDTDALRIAEPLSGPIIGRYRELAKKHNLWLSLGGFQEASPGTPTHRYNTHVLLDCDGTLRASYRKIHLFDLDIPRKVTLRESNATLPGEALCAADSPAGRLGLSVCYDLRFPALFQRLRFDLGAEILLIPAAFTVPTGEAHWEVLLRARATECQCYVVAAAQAGAHNAKRESYGHAMIVDPWGKVVARCDDPRAEGIAVAEIDLDWVRSVRQRMPLEQHREKGAPALARVANGTEGD